MEYYRITRWEEYQHRDHKKTMPWIKLHISLLHSEKFLALDNYAQLLYVKLLLLCGRSANAVSSSVTTLRQHLNITRTAALVKALKKLEELQLIEKFERAENAPPPLLDRDREEIEIKIKNPPTPLQGDAPHKRSVKIPDLIELWNTNCGLLPKIEVLSKKRAANWKARFYEKPDEVYWVNCIQRLSKSPFCCGDNDRGWRADVDFFIRSDTHIKISEGKYDSKIKQNKAEQRFQSNVDVIKQLFPGASSHE